MVIKTNSQLSFSNLLPLRLGDYWLYHDEIWPERGRLPFTAHGTLLVPNDYRLALYSSLQVARDGFGGRMKSTRLPTKGPHYKVAQRWLDDFFAGHIEHVSFKGTFAYHEGVIPLPYRSKDPAYEKHLIRSTSSNVVGHVRWVLRELDTLHVRPVFDTIGNGREQWFLRWGMMEAAGRINRRNGRGKRGYPLSTFDPIDFQSGNPTEATTLDEAINAELLQLTDLLLGATADALKIRPALDDRGRLVVAGRVTDEMAARFERGPFAFSRYLRHMSISLYPDAHGRMYAPTVVRTPADGRSQLVLL